MGYSFWGSPGELVEGASVEGVWSYKGPYRGVLRQYVIGG
jgi:hypothetical protein